MDDWRGDAPGVRRKITVADLPPAHATPSVDNQSHLIPRPQGAWPKAPAGFVVQLVTSDLKNPRKVVAAPNGDLFIAESQANRVRVVRVGPDGKLRQSEIFAENLSKPFGIAFYPPGPNPKYVYVGNTDSIVRFPYQSGDTKARGPAEKLADLPGGGKLRGGGHWTRDLVFSADGQTLFASVGSHSNNDDNPATEKDRADVLVFTPEGKDGKIFASGIRNAVGLAIEPKTRVLWGSVNERDELGDDLVPDYITHIEPGGFYGWPWLYLGNHQDPKHTGKHPELADKVIVPDVLVASHSASLCMTFYQGDSFPAEYRGDAFAAEHGSWNRSRRTGYKVIRVPMKDGKATGEYEDFMTGFVTQKGEVWGRPVGVAVGNDGALYVTDDGGNCLWRIVYQKE